jgi:murein DD-endopeptidase MepM/ murein hydrolase activator NlpD
LASLQRHRGRRPAIDLGDEDPLYTRNIGKGPPDRRRVSLRWLAGSVLTGIFSFGLVGGALQAAIGLADNPIVRPALAHTGALGDSGAAEVARKGDRFRPVPQSEVTRRVIQISTVTRSADRDIVRVRPFAHVRTNLAAPVPAEIAAQVPSFSPLNIFAEAVDSKPQEIAGSDSIYGAEVDGEVSIKVQDFPLAGLAYDETAELAASEVEQNVRQAAPFLADGAVEVASLPYVDPARFEIASADPNALASIAVAITPENLSLIEKSEEVVEDFGVEEKVLTVAEGASLRKMLIAEGASEQAAAEMQSALVANFSFDFRAGQKLRLGLAPDDTGAVRPVRVSLYAGDSHLATVALADTGTYVAAAPPALDDELFVAEEKPKASGALPNVYAGLWGTGLSLDMPKPLIEKLVHIFSFDADYQSRLSPTDSLEVIYSAEGSDGEAEGAEILYASLTLGSAIHRFYRFRDADDGTVDYYDEAGKSAQKFLVRKPVAQGRFSSSFGMRRHPILGRYRLHSGVDWAAPTGTPIVAAGNGVVEKIGTRAGYGRSVTLKHTNGYATTYNHMSGYARGLSAGDRVHQGQVIGYVGSTGLSTGPHLHYEVLVNGRFVDPMKIRVPRGRELQGAELAAFEQERSRIEDLLARDGDHVASASE